jgi:DNA polymerase I
LKEKFIILDGHNLVYRAFYALPLLQNTQGQFTNAVYGFISMLLRLLKEENPTHLAVAFDLAAPTFRHKEYADYKAQRKKAPDELREQIPLLKEILKAMQVETLEIEGFEADDIIGTCCEKSDTQGIDSLIVTGDGDVLQLISPRTRVALVKKGITQIELLDISGLDEKMGLSPAQVVDYKALKGDPSDNIPGVPGIGDKTALRLLKLFPSLEEILDNPEKAPGEKIQNNLRDFRDQALLSKRLATICRHVPLDFEMDQFKRRKMDAKRVRELFKELEFTSLLSRLDLDDEGESLADNDLSGIQRIRELLQDDLHVLLEALQAQEPIFLYFCRPLTKSHSWKAEPQGLAIRQGQKSFYVPLTVPAQVFSRLQPVLEDPARPKITTQGKDMINYLAQKGIHLQGLAFDVSIAAYLLDPIRKDFSLASLGRDFLHLAIPEEKEAPLPPEAALHLLESLYAEFKGKLADLNLNNLYFKLEMPLVAVLAAMEQQGVKVEAAILKDMGKAIKEKEDHLREEIYTLAGETFNINSPSQLRLILFEKLKLPVIKKTKSGPSTDASVLEELAGQHEIVAKILLLRYQFKLRTTYVEGLLNLMDPETGKIHTTYNQTVTATGRLSSTEPNLQNIPIRQEEGRLIRKAFVPSEEGWALLAADYSQIELRLLAHLSQDDGLSQAFREGQDIHRKTAAEVCHVPLEEVTDSMRSGAKAINFGIIYGMSDYGLSQSLNISRGEAADFIERYFNRYPRVKVFMDEIIKGAREKGYVTTLLNRRRYLPDINHKNFNLRSFSERTAINTPIQGTAADIIKKAMVKMAEGLKREGLRARMLLQVHDELVFEVPAEELEETAFLVREIMENAISLEVPLTADLKYGQNWLDMKPLP